MAKKKAVLIGCNYPSTKAELKGCVNDVHRVHRSLIELFGFDAADIVVLVDTNRSYLNPTGRNIYRALTALVESARPGDCLFVHYSGHGTRLPAETGAADDTGYDECIVPTDFNLITDEDFRELVCNVPDGCRLTIISDSCHSGGLIGGAKEQIGESMKTHHDHEHNNPSISDLKGFLKQTVKDTIRDAFESRGMHIPLKAHASRHYDHNPDHSEVADEREHCDEYVGPRSLPLSTLIEILKEKTGKEDIEVGKLRPTLFDIFREEASPKVKKFVKFLLNKLNHRHHQHHRDQGGQSGILAKIGSLALEFLKQKLEENDEEYVSPVTETHVETVEEVYADNNKKKTPENGILLSGCQTDQTSADASPSGNNEKAYGAFSNAIQSILAETNGKVSNAELVSRARKLLKKQGFTQRPGLYCSDVYVDTLFIC